jgi:hypothetical protein
MLGQHAGTSPLEEEHDDELPPGLEDAAGDLREAHAKGNDREIAKAMHDFISICMPHTHDEED